MNRRTLLTSLLGLTVAQEPRPLAKLERARGACPVCQSKKFTGVSERVAGSYKYVSVNADGSGNVVTIAGDRLSDSGLGIWIPPTHKQVSCDECSACFLVELKK